MQEDERQDGAASAVGEANDGAAGTRLEAEMAGLKDQLLRALADQENLRRRAAREREDAVKFAAAGVIKDLLPIADSVRRAIESVPENWAADDQLIRDLLAGVVVTEWVLLDAFGKHGIRRIDPAPGEAFDPHRHQAILEEDDARCPAGTVTQVLQPGYAYHERLLRPALVGVARGGGADVAAAASAQDKPLEE